MGLGAAIADRADDIAEKAAFEKGGYPGWFKFKMMVFYQKTKDGVCCA
jgi:hypothetical protein